MENEMKNTKVVVFARFSYVKLSKPESFGDSDPKYSISLIIPKSDKDSVAKIKKAIENATSYGISDKWGGKKPANIKVPLRDGDTERADRPEYKDSYFLNASCKTKPGVVDRNRQEITDLEEVYSGCYGYASINFYAYKSNGSTGIACGLNNIMKVKEGEPLGGRVSAEEDFADVKVDEDDPF
jgi:hypothetical protein